MHKIVDNVLVLKRIDYGEADRILSVLSESGGKFSLLARGVRKPKSKLAGGIEPFCINNVTYMQSQNELKRLVSANALLQLSNITKNLETLETGYKILRTIHAYTEHECENSYYTITSDALVQMHNGANKDIVYVWFMMQLLKLSGHGINTDYAADGAKLLASDNFEFDLPSMAFEPQASGHYSASHIKVLRIASALTVKSFSMVQETQHYASDLVALLSDIASLHTQKNLK
ncbi:DNA repair protein RecO [bacterium]|nr:DNA repair protein RecO [bacterium]NBX97885.1 DNA repair protein RecO [bacterium]NDC93875.1 DNA repair protein RecO [bacterium]NDD82822.1 DNA repair protein RecO [bacterium]NDG28729.1 DNA repair protein RecO [bacterium]